MGAATIVPYSALTYPKSTTKTEPRMGEVLAHPKPKTLLRILLRNGDTLEWISTPIFNALQWYRFCRAEVCRAETAKLNRALWLTSEAKLALQGWWCSPYRKASLDSLASQKSLFSSAVSSAHLSSAGLKSLARILFKMGLLIHPSISPYSPHSCQFFWFGGGLALNPSSARFLLWISGRSRLNVVLLSINDGYH